jgi:uncharacterized membrane protein
MLYFFVALFLFLPILVLECSRRFKLMQVVGPVVWCYLLGITLGNLIPGASLKAAARSTSEISVLLAIPMLLFSANLSLLLKLARQILLSFSLVLVSVLIISFSAFMVFQNHVEEASKIAGMLVGVFTGGTPNMVAIGLALKVKEEAFILLNAADLVLGGLFLLFLMTGGRRIFQALLPPFSGNQDESVSSPLHWSELGIRYKFRMAGLMLLASGLIVGLAVGSSQLLFKALEVPYIVLVITALGIALSFWPRWRDLPGSYETGQYLLLVFCISIGSLANIKELFASSGIYFGFVGFVLAGSFLLHLLLCRLFQIDRDTALITSVAAIYGPPFVGPFATMLNNRQLLVAGISCGLLGYALGNYLGIGLYYLLTTLATSA